MKCLPLLWGLALLQLPAWGQGRLRADDALERAERLLLRQQPDSALALLHSTLHHIQSSRPLDVNCGLEVKTALGKVHYHQARFDSAQCYIQAAAQLAHEQGYLHEYGHLQSVLGAVSRIAHEPIEAVRALRQAIATARQTGDSVSLGNALGDLSNIYKELGSHESSRKLQAEARRIFERLHDTLRLAVLYYNIGGNFEEHNPDSLLHYRRLAWELMRTTANRMRVGETLYGLAHAYELTGDWPAAIRHYHQAMPWLEQRPENRNVLWATWAGLMQSHRRTDRPDSAAHYADRLRQALATQPLKQVDPDLHLQLARHYESFGQGQQALHYYNRYIGQQDSIREAHQLIYAQIIDLENELETENLRHRMMQVQLDQKTDRQWAYGVAASVLAVLLVVAVGVALRMRQLKQRVVRSLAEVERVHGELQAANAELRELSHFRELLLGTIVHDLKTPLNSILGLTMLPPSERNRDLIFRSGKKMLGQVHDLLDIQRLEQARLELKLEPCSVDELLEQALGEVLFEAQQRRIDVAIGWLRGQQLTCDVALLQRVLVNLLTNAIKFSPQGSRIEVAAHRVPEGLLFEVNDQGPGVPEHLREVIFERYSQVQGKDLGTARSTGLGLTFCKLAVEAHGGRINVENRPATGASFRVVLPPACSGPAADAAIHRHPDTQSA